MIIRASCDIQAGSEITFCYSQPDEIEFHKVQKKLRHWEFVCKCAICSDLKGTSAVTLRRRQGLMQKIMEILNSSCLGHVQVNKIERLLHVLDETYVQPATVVPRLLLSDLQIALAGVLSAQNRTKKSLEWAGNALKSLGFIIVGANLTKAQFRIEKWGFLRADLVELFLMMQIAFLEMGALDSAIRAKGYARTAFKILVGEDDSFETIYN